ncbi:hypothetical protein L6452_37671 [Arctium lappa]|uniref:Uncharacterized protein n=1 Tax=Arctium lappa TaxID=4217 RepID=A0ACB8Y4C7_ARCLA|nr:hypothetical protein L6452_37671 [Arctium lappa]
MQKVNPSIGSRCADCGDDGGGGCKISGNGRRGSLVMVEQKKSDDGGVGFGCRKRLDAGVGIRETRLGHIPPISVSDSSHPKLSQRTSRLEKICFGPV